MMRLRLSEISKTLGLPIPESAVTIESIVTDSRKVRYGSLFAALPGNVADGHDFVKTAAKTGAVAVLVQKPVEVSVPQLLVNDVLRALGQIAAMWRQQLDPTCLLYTSPSPRDRTRSRMPSSA